jgi:integrase
MSEAGVRQLAKTRWSVRVKRVDARTGKPVNRKAIVTGTKAAAIAKREELRAELAGGGPKARMRLAAFALAWLARRELKQSTRDKYAVSLRHILEVLGDHFIDMLSPAVVAEYIANRTREVAGNTALNELRLLRVIARDTVAEGLAERYWCERVPAPKVARYDDEHPNLFTPELAMRVVSYVSARWKGLVAFLLTTGLRIGEATALRWDDLDVAAGVARIHRGNYKGNEQTGKTLRRTVPLLPEVLALLGTGRPGKLVFATRRGAMHKGSPLRYQLTRACKLAGVDRVTQHGLRRTFNNQGRQLGDREVLKATTGHSTDEMVSHYSHVDAGEKAKLARAVGSRLGVIDAGVGERVLSVSDGRTTSEAKP